LTMASAAPAAFIGIGVGSIGSIDVEWDAEASTLRVV
jgi:hypothetical protein